VPPRPPAPSETIIVVGLQPGPHKLLIELANPMRKAIASETVNFTVPDPETLSDTTTNA
jgi:Family of unknown function (DUF6130)